MYLHARYYDPAIGLFLSPDPSHPASAGVGTNRYAYGMQDPIDNRDPRGLTIINEPEQYCYWKLTTITTIRTVPPFGTTTSYRIELECTRGATIGDLPPDASIQGPRAPFMPTPCDMNDMSFRCLGPDAPKKPRIPPAIPPSKPPEEPPPHQPPPNCSGQPECRGQLPPTPPSKPQPVEHRRRTIVPLGMLRHPERAINWHDVLSRGNEWGRAGRYTGGGVGAILGFIFSPPGAELATTVAGGRIGASLGGLVGFSGGALHSVSEQSPGVLHYLQGSAYGGVW
jgi:hypothetical protein